MLDTELVDEAPILDLRVRKAVRRNGARLVVASSRPSTLDASGRRGRPLRPRRRRGGARRAGRRAGLAAADANALGELADRAGISHGFVAGRPQLTHVNGDAPRGDGAGAARALADVLRGAGDVVIVLGERVLAGERGGHAAEALLALADALGIAGKAESGLIEIPAETNGRGLREVGCSPGLAPGLADAEATGTPDDAGGALLLLETRAPEAELAPLAPP